MEIDELAQNVFGFHWCCGVAKSIDSNRKEFKTEVVAKSGIVRGTTDMSNAPRRSLSAYRPSSTTDQQNLRALSQNSPHACELRKIPGALQSVETKSPGHSLRACVAAENVLVGRGTYPSSESLTPRTAYASTASSHSEPAEIQISTCPPHPSCSMTFCPSLHSNSASIF